VLEGCSNPEMCGRRQLCRHAAVPAASRRAHLHVGGVGGGVQRPGQVVGQPARQVAGRGGVQLHAEPQRRLLRHVAEAGRLPGPRLGQVPKRWLLERGLQEQGRS
jgi:hypothetical protein